MENCISIISIMERLSGPSSITFDHVSELDYAFIRPDYSNNNLSSRVLGIILKFLIMYWILPIRVPLSMFLMGRQTNN